MPDWIARTLAILDALSGWVLLALTIALGVVLFAPTPPGIDLEPIRRDWGGWIFFGQVVLGFLTLARFAQWAAATVRSVLQRQRERAEQEERQRQAHEREQTELAREQEKRAQYESRRLFDGRSTKSAADFARKFKDVILIGDFNFPPDGPGYDGITETFLDTALVDTANASKAREAGTYGFPLGCRIDYIFVRETEYETLDAGVADYKFRHASDHRAYFAKLRRR